MSAIYRSASAPRTRVRPLASPLMARLLDSTGHPLTLVSVHAHPDDEASKGAGTGRGYAAEGIRAVLVCCTGGEEGEILNPAADTPGGPRRPGRGARWRSLRASADDRSATTSSTCSGTTTPACQDTDANARPDNFANAPLDEAVERLVAIIRRERPQVLVTYGDDRDVLPAPRPHPGARDLGGRRSTPPATRAVPRRRDRRGSRRSSTTGVLGPASRRCTRCSCGVGEESPYAERLASFDESLRRRRSDDADRRRRLPRRAVGGPCSPIARRSTRTSHWMRVPDDVVREMFPWEEYVLARALVPTPVMPGGRARGRPVRRAARAGPSAPEGAVRRGDASGDVGSTRWLDGWRGRGRAPGGRGRRWRSSSPGSRRRHSLLVALSRTGAWSSRTSASPLTHRLHADACPSRSPEAIADGRRSTPSAAFMQGRMKTAGDHAVSCSTCSPARRAGELTARSAGVPRAQRALELAQRATRSRSHPARSTRSRSDGSSQSAWSSTRPAQSLVQRRAARRCRPRGGG